MEIGQYLGLTKIFNWLKSSTANLINCAVNALYNLIDKLGFGQSVSIKALLEKSLLVDILTGVITTDNAKGELNLSMFSIQQTAMSEGLTLNGYNIADKTIANVNSLLQTGPFIAHFNINHFAMFAMI